METMTQKAITIQTTVNAPVEKVWKYWNQPEHITKWAFASDDWHAPKAENDLRVDGTFSTTMAAKDGSFSFDFGGVYTKVENHKIIEYTIGDGRKVKVEFVPEGNQTKVVETFELESQNPEEMQRGGWQANLAQRHFSRAGAVDVIPAFRTVRRGVHEAERVLARHQRQRGQECALFRRERAPGVLQRRLRLVIEIAGRAFERIVMVAAQGERATGHVLGDAVDDRAHVGAVANDVSQVDAPVGLLRLCVGEAGVERLAVGVDVGEECEAHGSGTFGGRHEHDTAALHASRPWQRKARATLRRARAPERFRPHPLPLSRTRARGAK